MKFTHIVHLSDIHIRTGSTEKSRFYEYNFVFSQLYQSLSNLESIKQHTAMIVVLGDLFQEKNKIESPGLLLYNKFINLLTNLAPVYIIQGNHDYRQDQPDAPDMISSITYGQTNNNFHYLDKTGIYESKNIGFSLVDIKETLRGGNTSGQVQQLPIFPKDFSGNIQHKIALFHGTVINSTLQNYDQSKEGYPLEWFDGFDLVLLGDVHLRQIHKLVELTKNGIVNDNQIYHFTKGSWGYPGSLIQQNFGEPIYGHGYLVWDLENKTVIPIHIKNNYGMLNIKCIDQIWFGFYDNTYNDLISLIDNNCCPNNLLLKIKGNSDHISIQQLQNILSEHHINYKIINNMLNFDINSKKEVIPEELIISNIEGIDSFNSPENWIEFIENCDNKSINFNKVDWKSWLRDPYKFLISSELIYDSLKTKVDQRNTKINTLVNNFTKSLNQVNSESTVCNLNLVYIQWQWLLPYKNNCWFDFTKASGNICTLNSKNDSGKSSFLEIIVLSLFGDSIPSRKNDSFTGSVICKYKPPNETSLSTVIFTIDNKTYKLHRQYNSKDDNKLDIKNSTLFIQSDSNKEFIELKSGNAVKEWIREYIGTIDSFLLSTMLTQNNDQDFLSMNKKDQSLLLNKALKIDNITKISELLKETGNMYKSYYDLLETIYTNNSNNIEKNTSDNYDQLVIDYDLSVILENELKQKLSNIPNYHHLNIQDIELDDNIIDNNLKKCNESIIQIDSNLDLQSLTEQLAIKNNQFESIRMYYNNENHYTKVDLDHLLEYSVTKPHFSEQWLKEEKNKIDDWKNKTSNKSQLIKTLTELNQEHQDNVDKLNHLFENPVIKPKYELSDYIEWKNNYKNQMNIIQKRLNQSIYELNDKQDLIKWCKLNPSVEPTMSISELELLKKQLDNEKKQILEKRWFELDDTEIKYNYDMIKTDLLKYTNDRLDLETRLKSIKIKQDELNKQIDTLSSKLKLLRKSAVREPIVPKNVLTEWKTEYESLKLEEIYHTGVIGQYHDTVIQYTDYEKQLDMVAKSIEKITSEIIDNQCDLPFNPNCEACQKQPWKLKLNKLESQKYELSIEYASIQTKLNILVPENEINDIKKKYNRSIIWCEYYSVLENKKIEYTMNLDQWDKYEKYLDLLNQTDQEYDENKNLIDSMTVEYNNINQELVNITQKIHETIIRLKEADIYISNYQRWNEISKEIDQQTQMWNTYQQNSELNQLLDKWNQLHTDDDQWTTEFELITNYQKWIQDKLDLQNKIQQLQSLIKEKEEQSTLNDRIEICEKIENEWNEYNNHNLKLNTINACMLNSEICELETQIQIVKNNDGLLKDILYWDEVKKYKPYWILEYQIKNELDQIESINKDKLVKLNLAKYNNNKLSEIQFENNKISHIMSNVHQIYEVIDEIKNKFGDYKFWLYNHKIIPAILREANQLVKSINSEDHYMLEATVDNNSQFTWFINNGLVSNEISKSGGFRKFIYGLAIRIVLSYLGASKIMCNQLFIDEGFVSADSDNLEKIPDFLRGLLRYYDSIIMVSHLDTLKEIGDINASITRIDKQSQLQFGDKIDEFVNAKERKKKNTFVPQSNSTSEHNTIVDNSKCIAFAKNGKKCQYNKKNGDYCGMHSKMNK